MKGERDDQAEMNCSCGRADADGELIWYLLTPPPYGARCPEHWEETYLAEGKPKGRYQVNEWATLVVCRDIPSSEVRKWHE